MLLWERQHDHPQQSSSGAWSRRVRAVYLARAEPDGYTILTVQTSFATNAAVRAKMPYDVFSDFAYIGIMAKSPMIVVVHPSMPIKSIKELVALARRRPGELNYGSSGTGHGPRIPILAPQPLSRRAKGASSEAGLSSGFVILDKCSHYADCNERLLAETGYSLTHWSRLGQRV